jgi:hypothetical protein
MRPNWKITIMITVCLAMFIGCGIAANGEQGPPGVGIDYIVNNGDGTLTIHLTDGSSHTTDDFTGPQGPQGDTGPQGPQGDKGDTGFGLNVSHQTVAEGAEQSNVEVWGDLPDSYGPTVTVNIGDSGCALVTLTAELIVPASVAGFMSFSVTGASDLLPDQLRALSLVNYEHDFLGRMRTSGSFVVTGLNPGSNTFTAEYYSTILPCFFQYRTIMVQPLP